MDTSRFFQAAQATIAPSEENKGTIQYSQSLIPHRQVDVNTQNISLVKNYFMK